MTRDCCKALFNYLRSNFCVLFEETEREKLLREIDSRLQADCPICHKLAITPSNQPPRLKSPQKTLKIVKYYVPKPKPKQSQSEQTSNSTESSPAKSAIDKNSKTTNEFELQSGGKQIARKETDVVIPDGEDEKQREDLQKTSYKVLVRTGRAPKAGTNQPVFSSFIFTGNFLQIF